MYSVLDYGRMAADGVRMDAYARAIARAVKPGSVVLDLGSGTGIFALLAVRAGASRVHAVDVNPALWLVPELAAENDAADRIVIHHGSSLDLELPERVDTIVSDMRGITPLCGEHVNAIRDARTRWLAPDGVLIPARDRLFVAAVESDALASYLARSWQSFERLGFSANAAKQSILNNVYADRAAPLEASDVLTTSAQWGELDYRTYDGTTIEGDVELVATRSGIAHGLAVWFAADVLDEISYTAAPGSQLAYARYYLPLLEPVQWRSNDRMLVSLRADSRGDRWAWDATVVRDGRPGPRFRQSTFLGQPTDPSVLLRASSQFRPTLTEHGHRVVEALAAMKGTATVAEIVEVVGKDLTEARRGSLSDEVHDLVGRYAR